MKNKEITKKRLIWAVGETIKTDGFAGVSVSKVARKAQVDRKLISRYFGGLNPLIEAYIVENDYWMLFADHINELLRTNSYPGSKELITAVLQNQFWYFFSQKDTQRLILWELSAGSPLMKSIHNARESMGQKFLELTDPHFKGSGVNFRAVGALLVGGIYYIILHTMYNGGTFADIDVNSDQGREDLVKAIEQIVGWAFDAADQR